MKLKKKLFFVALGIAMVFNACKIIDGNIIDSTNLPELIPANSFIYPRIITELDVINNQIVVDLGGLDISLLDTIIPYDKDKVISCPCGDPNIKLLTLLDNFDVETAVASVRDSDDDSRVKADKNFEFGFPIKDDHGDGSITPTIADPLSLDLGFIDELDTSFDKTDPIIAIVDTGIFPNAFRKNEIALFRSNVVCDPVTAGRNFVDSNDNLSDDIMHGTFVAKRIAKRIKELDSMKGTSTKYRIMPLKVFSDGKGEYFDVVCAFSYIQQLINDGVQVPIINASFGSSLGNLALTDLLVLKKYIDGLNQSTIIVASAGNEGEDNMQIPHFPSGYNYDINFGNIDIDPSKNIVAVAGYKRQDDGEVQLVPKTSNDFNIGSNFGLLNVDLAAPWNFKMEEEKKTGQIIVISGLQGTSYSAAYVSGDLLHFMVNPTDVLAPPNSIQEFLNTYYDSDRVNQPNPNIQVIGGKYVE